MDQWREHVFCGGPLEEKVVNPCVGGCGTKVDASDGFCVRCRAAAHEKIQQAIDALPASPIRDKEEQLTCLI